MCWEEKSAGESRTVLQFWAFPCFRTSGCRDWRDRRSISNRSQYHIQVDSYSHRVRNTRFDQDTAEYMIPRKRQRHKPFVWSVCIICWGTLALYLRKANSMQVFKAWLTLSVMQSMILFGSQIIKHLNHSKKELWTSFKQRTDDSWLGWWWSFEDGWYPLSDPECRLITGWLVNVSVSLKERGWILLFLNFRNFQNFCNFVSGFIEK